MHRGDADQILPLIVREHAAANAIEGDIKGVIPGMCDVLGEDRLDGAGFLRAGL